MTQQKCTKIRNKIQAHKGSTAVSSQHDYIVNEMKTHLLDATTYEQLTADCTVNLKSKILAYK